MNKFRYLTSEELLKCFRDKTFFYPVGFSSNEQFSFMIGTIDINYKTDSYIDYKTISAEVTLVSLYTINGYPIRHHVNQLELLRNWRFADGSPCGVEMGKRNQNMRKSRFEKEAAEYIKTHDDYRVFALDDADVMQIFKDGAEIGFQKGIKAKINTTTISEMKQEHFCSRRHK